MKLLSKRKLRAFNKEINDGIRESNYRQKFGETRYDEAHNGLSSLRKRKIKSIMEENEAVLKSIKSKLINKLVETEKLKLNICDSQSKKDLSNDDDDSTDLPPKIQSKYPYPQVNKKRMDTFLKNMEDNKCNAQDLQLKNCLKKLHNPVKSIWNSPICLLKAIKHSILTRKWNNLSQLLLILVHFTRVSYYRPIIYQYCDNLLNKYHPLIEESEVKNQFQLIFKGIRRK